MRGPHASVRYFARWCTEVRASAAVRETGINPAIQPIAVQSP